MGPTLFICLALVAGFTSAGPITDINTRDTCSITCTDSTKFGYHPGTTYEFDYDVDTTTLIQGASEGKSGIKMSAKVQMEVISKCDLVLKVNSVELHERNPDSPENLVLSAMSKEFSQNLEEHPLRFSFQDGRIDSLCPTQEEKTWVLNIKRGILSMIQNTMEDLKTDQKVKEVDVTGTCDSDYTVAQNGWYSVTIKKHKNLLGCTERHGYNTAIQGTPYRVPSEIQSMPVMKSTHECQQDISKSGILKESVCTEQHVFRPFSRESSGAMTDSKQTLKYTSERSGISRARAVSKKTDMNFEHSFDAAKATKTRKEIEKQLVTICEQTKKDIRPETPKLFSDLVHMMQSAEPKTLENVHKSVHSGALCKDNNQKVKKFFLDAIPMVGTTASVRMLTNLLIDKEVTGLEADMWMTTMTFIQHPTKEMIKELMQLLKKEPKSMLAISSMVNTYCKTSPCENDMEIANVVSALEDKIGYGCYVDDNNRHGIVMTLRALGNAGYITSAISTINSCISRQGNPIEVRLAALESFRRSSCDNDRSEAVKLFNNRDEDSELRIAAYLAMMQCPSESTLKQVRYALETEVVNQVGSFIWSHLTNLMESSSPLKQDIRSILENEKLKKEFDMDKRKFSRNYEGSFFMEKLNTGASVESNLVWSSKSFIPRSIMANLTVDLFGKSVNLLEIGGRIEGLEYFLESYFGPNGYFSEGDVKKATKQLIKGVDAKKMKKIDKQFGSGMDQLKGALYMRVFGNELSYNSFRGLGDILGGDSFNILEMLISMSKNHDYTFTQNMMFLDSSMIIPTSSGFPLNLTMNGTATVDMKASGKIDLRKLGTSPRSLLISGEIQPSAAVEISSMMSVDAFVTKSGVKMISTLHSSTLLKGNVEMKDGKIFNANWDMPRDKMELFSFKSAFFTVHHNAEKEQTMIKKNRQTHKLCSGKQLEKITGLKLCGELQFPNASLKADAPYFPLTGPVNMEVSLLKTDTHKSYTMEAKMINDKKEINIKLAVDTPGSKVARLLSTNMIVNKAESKVQFGIHSPWKKASFEGELRNERNLRHLSGKLVLGKQVYSASAEVARTKKGKSFVYTPSVQITAPKMKPIRVKGAMKYEAYKMLDLDVTLSGVSTKPINGKVTIVSKKVILSAKASMSFEKKKDYIFESRIQKYATKKATKYRPFLSIRSPIKELAAFGGSIESKSGKSIKVDLTVDRLTAKPVKFLVMVRDLGNKKSNRYQTKVDIKSPVLTVKVQSNFVIRNKKALIVRTIVTYAIPKISRDTVALNGKINFANTKTLTAVKGNMNLNFKKNSHLNLNLMTDMSTNKKHTETEVDLRYGANKKDLKKRIFFHTALNHVMIWKQNKFNLDANSKLTFPFLGINFQLKGKHTQTAKMVDSDIAVVLGKKRTYSGSFEFKDKSKKLTSMYGQIALSFAGRNYLISNSINQPSAKKYTNVLTVQLENGKKNVIQSSYSKVGKEEFDVSTSFSIPTYELLTVSGQYRLIPENFQANTRLQYGKTKYAVSTSSLIKRGSLIQVAADVECPSRRVVAELETRMKSPVYSGKLELKWDANNDQSKQFLVQSEVTCDGIKNVDVTISKSSPLGNGLVNFKNQVGSKYLSHGHIEWNKQRGSIDTLLSMENNGLKGNVRMTSPFKGYTSIVIDVHHVTEKAQSVSSFDIDWKPMKKISSTLTLKTPLSSKNIEASLNIKSPLRGFEKVTVELKHSQKSKLANTVKMTWNRKFIQLDILSADRSSTAKRDITGRISLKSSLEPIQSIYVAAKHVDDGRKFENSANFEYNGMEYSYEGEMTHHRSGWQLQNNGRVQLSYPSNKLQSTWTHRNTLGDIQSSIKMSSGSQSIEFGVNGQQSMSVPRGSLSVEIGFKSPFESARELGFKVTHKHDADMIDNKIAYSKHGNVVTSVVNTYKRINGIASSKHEFSCHGSSKALITSIKYAGYPLSGKIVYISDQKSVFSLDGNIDVSPDNLMNGHLNALTRIPGIEKLHMSIDQSKERGETVTRSSLVLPSGKAITIENRMQWNKKKSFNIKISTPYSTVEKFIAGGEFAGDVRSFHTSAEIEIKPVLGKFSATSQWSSYGGILANLRINTPYAQHKYSQVSLTQKTENGRTKSEFSLEYLPQKTIKIESTVKPTLNDLEGSVKLTTPFVGLPYSAMSIRHVGDSQQFHCNGEIEYTLGKKMQGAIKFTKKDKIEGEIVLRSPFAKDFIASFSHDGDINKFSSNAEMQYGKSKRYELSTRYANKEGSIHVSTPLSDDLRASFKHSGDLSNFATHADAQYGQSTKYEIDAKYHNMDGSISIKSPHTENIKAAFKHSGKLSDFNTHAEFNYGKKNKYEGDVKVSLEKAWQGSLSVRSPLSEDMSLEFSHDGSLKEFKTQGVGKYGSKVVLMKASFKTGKKTQGLLELASPLTKNVLIDFSHQGTLKNFASSASLKQNKKTKFDIDISFTKAKRTVGSFSLKTPFHKDIAASLKHSGDFAAFKTKGDIKLNKKTEFGVEVDFLNKKRMKGTMKIFNPYTDPITIKVTKKGKPTNLRVISNMLLGKSKYSADLILKQKPRLNAVLTVATPLKGYKKIKTAIQHSGTWKSFKTAGAISLGKEAIRINMKIDLKSKLQADVSVETPFKGFKKFGAIISHQGSFSNFKCHGEMSKGKEKLFNGDIIFAAKPKIAASISLQTPFKRFENTEFSVTHEGPMNNFENQLSLVYLKKQKISSNLKMDTRSDIAGEVSIQTPYNGFEMLKGSFSHKGTWKKFEITAEGLDGSNRKFVGDVRINLLDQISGDITVSTPFKRIQVLKASISHDGTINNFRSHAEIQHNTDKSKMDLVFSSLGNLEGKLSVKSPYIQPLETSFSHENNPVNSIALIKYGKKNIFDGKLQVKTSPLQGSLYMNTLYTKPLKVSSKYTGSSGKFTTEFEAVYGKDTMISRTEFDSTNDITLKTSLTNSFVSSMKSLSASVSHSGNFDNFRCHAEATLNKKTIDGDVTFSSLGPIEASVNLRTPFKGFRESQVSIRHGGKITDFASHAELSLESKKSEIDLSAVTEGRVRLHASFKCPATKDVVFDLSHDGELKNFKSSTTLSHGDEKTLEGDISFQTRPSVSIVAALKSAVTEDMNFELRHDGTLENFKSNTELTINGEKKVEGNIAFSTKPTIAFSANLKSTCPVIEEIQVGLRHDGSLKKFNLLSFASYNRKRVSTDISLDTRGGIDGNFVLKTPISEDVKIALTHIGGLLNFQSSGSIEYSGKKQIEVESNLNSQSSVEGKLSVRTPFDTLKNLNVVIRHDGDWSAFKSSGSLSMSNKEMFAGDVSFKQNPVSGSINIRSIYGKLNGAFSHEQTSSSMISHGKIAFNEKKIQIDSDFQNANDLKGTISFSSPFEYFRNLGASFSHQQKNGKLLSKLILNSSDKSISGSSELDFNNGYGAKLNVQTPFNDIKDTSVSVNFVNTDEETSTSSKLVYGNGKVIEGKMMLSRKNKVEGQVSLKTPFETIRSAVLSFNHRPSKKNMKSSGEFVFNGKQIVEIEFDYMLKPLKANFIIKTPYDGFRETKGKISYTNSDSGISGHIDGTFLDKTITSDVSFEKSPLQGSIVFTTPFVGYEEMKASFNHAKSTWGFKNHIEITMHGKTIGVDTVFNSRRALSGTITVKTPFDGFRRMMASFNHDQNDYGFTTNGEVNVEGEKFTVDAALSRMSSITGSFTIKTPFEGYEKQSGSFSHEMSSNNGRTHAELIFRNKKIEADAYLNSNDNKEGKITVKTPFSGFKKQEISFTYEPSKVHVEGTFQGKTIELDSTLSTDKNIEGTISLKTPFEGFRQQELKLSHEFTNNGFRLHAEGEYNQQKIESDISFALGENGECRFSLKTPFTGYEDQDFSLTYEKSKKVIKGRFETNFNQKKVEAVLNAEYTLDFVGSIELSTPFSGFESQNMKVSHQYSSSSMKSHIEGTFRGETIEGDLIYQDNAIKISLKTPITGFEETSVLIRILPKDNSFKCHAEVAFNDQKYESDAAWKHDKRIEGTIAIKTPIHGFELSSLSFSHEQYASSMTSHAEITLYKKKSEVDISFTKGKSTDGKITIKTPFEGFENIDLSVSHETKSDQVKSEIQLSRGQQKFSASQKLDMRGPIDMTMAVRTPFEGFRKSSISINHATSTGTLHNKIVIEYGKKQKVQSEISGTFDKSNLIGSMTLNTPFKGYEELSASTSNSWSSSGYNVHLEGSNSVDKIELDSSLDMTDPVSASIVLKTPFSGYESTRLALNKNGKLDDLEVTAILTCSSFQTTSVSIKNMLNGHRYEGNIKIDTPYTDIVSIHHEQSLGSSLFTSKTEASMGSKYTFVEQTRLEYNSVPMIDISSTTTTTVEGTDYNTMLSFKHEGGLNNFKTDLSSRFGDKEITLNAVWKNTDSLEGTLSLKSPIEYLRNVDAKILHSGDLDQFSSSGEIQYGNMEKIEGKVDFFRQNWRRVNCNLVVKTPFDGLGETKFSLKHSTNRNSLKSFINVAYGSNQKIRASVKASKQPMELEMSLTSPFSGVEELNAIAKHTTQGRKYSQEITLTKSGQTIDFKSALDMESSPMLVEGKLTTPFRGLESSKLVIKHKGTLYDLSSSAELLSPSITPVTGEVRFRYGTLSDLDGMLAFSSGISGLENIKFDLENRQNGDECSSNVKASWNEYDSISAKTKYTSSKYWGTESRNGEISITTPFTKIRSLTVKGTNENKSGSFKQTLLADLNDERVLDVDMSYAETPKQAVTIVMRNPKPMSMVGETLLTGPKKSASLTLNIDTSKPDNEYTFETEFSDISDSYAQKQDAKIKLARSSRSVEIKGSADTSKTRLLSSMDILLNEEKTFGFDWENKYVSDYVFETGNKLKLRFPERSVQFTGSFSDKYGTKKAEGAMMWDADRDSSKKIGVTARMVPQGDATKADVSFEIPSIGKDVKLDSEMTLNRGSIIFDGKTEFKYSKDDDKTLIINSRIENVSIGKNKNYTFSFGLQHKSSSVDVQFKSHIATSDEKYSSGITMDYLTAKQVRKNFALLGEIDSLRQQLNLEVVSPLKSMSVSGNIKTSNPYKLGINNVYDNTKEIKSEITFDATKKVFDAQINYDIENPNNVLHFVAKYVNDSAVLAEVYREENSRRITDSLLAMRLNTSRILHTRLHWRPTMVQDIKKSGLIRISYQSNRVNSAFMDAATAVSDELNAKYNMIRKSVSEGFRPFGEFMQSIISNINKELKNVPEEMDTARLEQVLKEWNDIIESSKKVSWENFPGKDKYDLYVEGTKKLLKLMESQTEIYYGKLMDVISEQLEELSSVITNALKKYQDVVTKLSRNQVTDFVNSQYDKYSKKVSEIKLPSFADEYTSTIYNVRDSISSRMNGPVLKTLKETSSKSYQMALNAYKFWEIEENVKDVMQKIYEMIRKDIEEEFAIIKNSVAHLKNSKITVYNPNAGEIQMDTYLPVAMPSLKELPKLSVTKHINRINSYIPKYSVKWSSVSDYIPDSDILNWIPPFKAVAKVEGDRFTTFDGKEYQFSGKCTYILARDYVDGNFSVIMNYLAKGQKQLIVATSTQTIRVAPNGKLRIDGKVTEAPYKSSEISVSSEGDYLVLSGRGFTVYYSIPRDSLQLRLSGWYYGKIGGLFGTNDNEVYDDFRTSSRQIVTEVDPFVSSWEVDSKCR